MKTFLFLVLFLSTVSLNATPYYRFDNATPATIHDLLDDPLLVIRTKPPGHELSPYNLPLSWEYFAQIHASQELIQFKTCQPSTSSDGEFCHIQVKSIDSDFPQFNIETESIKPEKLWWQICDNPDFTTEPILQEIMEAQDFITLHPLAETILNPNCLYYFRARALTGDGWYQWSEPCPFAVSKPEGVERAHFEKEDENTFKLTWEAAPDSDTHFYVFASHSKDFVPSIYTGFHFGTDPNLVQITKECSIEIDPSFPYYRVIAEKNGRFSIPSPIINIWDSHLYPERDVLTVIDGKVCRMPIPCYYADLNDSTKAYWPHPYIPKAVWKKVKPYVLPENHPAKERLDRIFQKNRAILNPDTMKKAGFTNSKPRKYTHLIVTKHPDLEGYIMKVYLDAQRLYKRKPAFHFWVLRAKGADKVYKAIDERDWHHLYKVPKKWIYPLPPEPSPPKEFQRKNFILIEEDMGILNDKENRNMWGSTVVTTTLLDQVYSIIEELGLSDCAKPDNIPFSKDGKIAFVDTQTFESWPVRYDKLTPFLSKPMKEYWKTLTKKK